jgi:hypothetical protein
MKRPLGQIVAIAALAALPSVVVGQNLSGTVVADDTGTPIAGATVVAIQKTATASQKPAIYKASVDATGRYAMTVSAGQYQLCVHSGGLYLDPCQWGGTAVRSVTGAGIVSASLRLQKGAWLILRVHDTKGLLPPGEAVRTSSVGVHLTGAAVKQFPLPVVYDNGRIRDYGAVVPMNAPLSAVVGSGIVVLADANGAAPGAQGIPFQVSTADVNAPPLGPASLGRMFPRPTAKIVHVVATGRK